MDAVTVAMKSFVSISDFNKGMAGNIFESVRKTGPKIVLKHNEPECVLMSPEDYETLIDRLEDAEDYALAVKRMSSGSKPIPWEKVMEDLGITEEEIEAAEDDEIE